MDWIFSQEEKLVEMMADWQVKLAEAPLQTAYEWPAAECAATITALTLFLQARATYRASPTAANLTEKNELKRAAIEAMRKFARERIRNNSKMNDGQKKDLGVAITDREPSPIPVPDAGPDSEAVINAREPGVVKARYLGPKPYGVDRVEIAWKISEDSVDSPDQLPNHETFPRNPWEHTFAAAERGKKMYYSMRYLTKEGASHWSDVREVIVP
jgi:hypothetical protein